MTGYRRLLAIDRSFYPDFLYALQLSKDGTYQLREVRQDDELLDACLFINKALERKKK